MYNSIANSSKVGAFLLDKKFALGFGIAVASTLFLKGILFLVCTDEFGKNKLKTGSIMGTAVVASSAIVCASLVLANKVSPEKAILMSQIFAGIIAVAFISFLVFNMLNLVNSYIDLKSETSATQPEDFRRPVIITSKILDMIAALGGFSFMFEGIEAKNSGYNRSNMETVTSFLDIFELKKKFPEITT